MLSHKVRKSFDSDVKSTPYESLRCYVTIRKNELFQVQLKVQPSKCSQISLKLIASCPTMFNLPENQFSSRLKVSKKSY